jgi:hypothetical protein
LIFLVLILLIVVICIAHSGATWQSVNDARTSGADAGQFDGKCAGDLAGFADAESRAYERTISEVFASGQYYRPPWLELATVICSFVVGYLFQYCIFYLSRAFGLLGDIDWIVLSPEAIQEISDLGNQEISALLKQDLRKLDSKMRTDAKPN